jgi:hypothetical protein
MAPIPTEKALTCMVTQNGQGFKSRILQVAQSKHDIITFKNKTHGK